MTTFAERQALAADLSRIAGGLTVRVSETIETLQIKDPKVPGWQALSPEQARARYGLSASSPPPPQGEVLETAPITSPEAPEDSVEAAGD